MLSLALLLPNGASAQTFIPVSATNQESWLGEEHFPTRALGLEMSGVTQADIFVDANGKPHNCVIDASSGSNDLDGQSCAAAIHRGRFTPARDENGQPISGVFRYRTHWQLAGKGRHRPPADVTLAVSKLPDQQRSLTVRLRYIVDEAGKITHCAVDAGSGFPKVDAAACAAMPKRYVFAPARDNTGRAWRVVRTQSVAFEVTPPS